MDLTREMPFATLRHLDQFDPGMVSSISPHNVVGAIRRAIAYDNPLEWPHSLRNDGLYGQFDELGFIASRRDDCVGW